MNGKEIPHEGLHLGMDYEKNSVMGYRTLFEASGIHNLKSAHQTSHPMHINVYFILLFGIQPDLGH